MVPRDDQDQAGQTIEEGPRRPELLVSRALREVAADRDQPGPARLQIGQECFRHRRVFLAEVQVRDMRDRGHQRGTITRRARGRMR